jgi:hypothetical protein
MTDRTTPPELEWEEALKKLYRRKSDERKGDDGRKLQEGDPRQFRAAAAELTAKAQGETLGETLTDVNQTPIELMNTLENPRLVIHCWDEILPKPFTEQEINLAEPETLKAEAILGKVLWEILQQFGHDEAYGFLTLIAEAGESAAPWQVPFQVNSSDLIENLYWQRNNDKPIDQFVSVIQLVDRICKLTIAILQTKMEEKGIHQHTANQINSSFWSLIGTNYISRLGRTSSSSHSGGFYRNAYPKDIEFTFVPGHWLSLFVQHNPNQVATLIEFSRIARGILRINPTRKKLASRLAIFLTAIEPLHQSGTYRVRDLLTQIESDGLQAFDEARSIRTTYKSDEAQTRILVRWNNALRRLKHLEWVLEFDDETYPNALRPIGSLDDDNDDDNTVPGRFENWFNTWLDGRLTLRSSPAEIRFEDVKLGNRPLGSRISRPRRARPSAPQTPAPITGVTLDVALTLKGWSKAQLSYQLHMDRSMITHWIKGSRPISTEQRKKLWKILGKELTAAQRIRY